MCNNCINETTEEMKINKEPSKELNDEDIIKINNLLSKKNLIIIGNNNFIEKIKIIKKDIKIETIKYLKYIFNYIKDKNRSDTQKK